MQTFPIAPASLRVVWFVLPLLIIPVSVAVLVLGLSLSGMKKARFEVSSDGLRLSGDLYGRTIPVSDLRGGAAQRVELIDEFRPTRRRVGTALPGYRSGWFTLGNGERALLYVTDPTKVVYVPTRAGYAVMVSPIDPDGFLSAIQSIAPGQ
jgi:Bacterial PH domain